MKAHTVSKIRGIIAGKLVQGMDDTKIYFGAYRIKQIKHKNTILFTNKRIVNWKSLEEFFPLVLATEWNYKENEIPDNVTVIYVANSEHAYWTFIHYYRSLFDIPVVAITGTSGKTTTKEMIKHILSFDHKVTATNLTSNSRTAYLQYLLKMEEDTEAAIFETAVGAPGDVLKAGEYFKPTIGIITNIGAHHLNYCKTLEGYIAAKGEMVDIIDPTGVLIINGDDINTRKINVKRFSGKIVKVGKKRNCHFKAMNIHYRNDGMQFSVQHKNKNYQVFVPGFGEHQVYNALYAIAAVYEMGVSVTDAAKRLRSFIKYEKQLQVLEGINGSLILDDTWSLTTTSLQAALKVLNEVGAEKKKIAIIGTITDLGSWGYIIHKEAGSIVYQNGVDLLITIGFHAKIIADHAVELGLKSPVYKFNNGTLAYNLLKEIVDDETIILIKGDMYSQTIKELAFKLRNKPT
ncbi:UDP-N-acetylmuramoyl-tripeptide--D-alanyl-D-alanine ligase [Psychrobacillus sp. OK028]|uniref:Mur ligase family protein n=1 Tax=Psychrobacillus sp. OK028 TaxID=1884359 RepID=UPI0008830CCE|nr:Mur ligase family protein [Psychrobacillus sp. OK028]SDN62574.1 UDP-N-acetylmuramoyl-tripeptide--D-alanyl-D-alanine ligase [Psychrobacillus sp. OK028]